MLDISTLRFGRTDVGLLEIEADALPVASIGDSTAAGPGDRVAAISSPFGFHGSATAGVVSAVGRAMGGAGDIPFIQTDVAIDPPQEVSQREPGSSMRVELWSRGARRMLQI